MSHIIHRSLLKTPLTAARAQGIHIYDQHNKAYIDASGGAAVSCLGHGHPDVLAAMHAQIDQHAYAHTGFFTSEVTEELANHLIEHAPKELGNVYFVSGGSEAVEASLKLARQYCVEIGQPERTVFVARRQSYHGNTLGALAISGNEQRRKQFAPLLMDVPRVGPCYEYRDRGAGETQDAYTARLLKEIEDTFLATGPEKIIAFCAETVGGATAGVLPPTPGYFRGVRALCDRYGILLIADEVMCGMGRTGTLYAFEPEQIIPDIVVIAKGLGGGYQPIGAFLAHNRIIDALRQKIVCVEDPAYTVDYHDPSKRSIANAITITCTDGTVFGEEVVEYPIGHARRRTEGIPLLIEKFKINLARIFPADQQKKILDLCLDRSKLEATPVDEFMFLLVK
jgi:adenosylmethionine-8-amino-7-oxononanoate aminotransferase